MVLFGYDPDDPVRGLEIPDRLLIRLAQTEIKHGNTYTDTMPKHYADRLGQPLTKRQIEVLELIACGYTNKQIAEKMHVSYETIKTNLRKAATKLGAKSRIHAVVLGIATRQIGQ